MRKHDGFTLVEVLVTAVVLAVGLLGLAALQATGVRNNLSAYHRSQATQLAYDIADKIRSNATVPASYLVTETGLTAISCPTATIPCTACGSPTNTCSTAELAQKDLYDWKLALSTVLPSGKGSIAQAGAGVDAIYTISVNWDDDRDPTTNSLSFQASLRL